MSNLLVELGDNHRVLLELENPYFKAGALPSPSGLDIRKV
jgi:hypothetical protein